MFPTHILAAGAFIVNDQKQILLVKTYNRSWQIPGGQVENGEDLTEAVIREVKEESGMDIQVNKMIGMYSNTGTYTWDDGTSEVPTKLIVDFSCIAVGGKLETSVETAEVKWIPIEEIHQYINSSSLLERFKAFEDQGNRLKYINYEARPNFNIKNIYHL